MNIETTQEHLQCAVDGHLWAEVHGYWTGGNDRIVCVDLCARCGDRRERADCEVWKWCVPPLRWEQIVEERKTAARRMYERQ